MITVQMTLDATLVKAVDKRSKKMGISRSAVTRIALAEFLANADTREKEKRHIQGYSKIPVKKGEFSVWDNEQIWPE
jgi:metal-responsive CopG/Arc/MetJ family transcriptional regulator